MGMRRSMLLLAMLSVVLLGVNGQECTSCAVHEQAKKEADAKIQALQQHVATLKQEKDSAVSSLSAVQIQLQEAQASLQASQASAVSSQVTAQAGLASARAECDNTVAQWKKHADELKATSDAKIQELETQVAQWKKHANDLKATSDAKIQGLQEGSAKATLLEGQLQQAQAAHAVKVRQLEESLKAAIAAQSSLNASAIFATLKAQAITSGTAAFHEGKLLFDELKSGNTSRLERLCQTAYTHVNAAATWAYTTTERGVITCAYFVAKEYEEHVPEEYKKKIAEASAKVQELWKQHVVDAVWAKELFKYANAVNDELKAFLVPQLKKNPQTEFLTDPVYLQLIIVGMVGAPLMVLILPVLLCCAGGSSKSREAPAASTKSKSAKKKAAKKLKA